MKAIRFDAHGSFDELRLVEVPDLDREPGRGRVPGRVTDAGINPLDHGGRLGWVPFAKGPPLVPGIEGVGTVMDPGSSSLKEGTRVMFTGRYGVFHDGTWQEQVWVSPEAAIPVPST